MAEPRKVTVKCSVCGRIFPCHIYANQDEENHARGLARTAGGGVLRVARYCPYCGETVMVELTIPAAEDGPVQVPLSCDRTFISAIPRPGEVDRH